MSTSEYDWEACAQDLAMATRLTLRGALDLTWSLRATSLDPEIALPYLCDLVNLAESPTAVGGALARLLEAVR